MEDIYNDDFRDETFDENEYEFPWVREIIMVDEEEDR